ncbi:MAG: DUF2007 domain-containing protein [Verrucomicrobia bacterium]|nr:DUF2007 domain-containing protein [Verrucomicrobiota bacterium]
MALVTVFKSFNPAEAQLIRSRLDAADIDSVVNHELAGLSVGYTLATGGVLVQVAEEDADAARELIEAPPVEPDSSANA